MPASADTAGWIRLAQTEGVGPDTARRLLAAFGLPEAIFATEHSRLSSVVSERVTRALLSPPTEQTRRLVDATLEWCTQPDNRVLTLADTDYPPALLEIADPPMMLYLKGRHSLLGAPSIAIVGSRNASAQGLANAERFAETLSSNGLTVVSGMALGIDTAAHLGGLRGKPDDDRGSTLAVIGTGLDIVYPARNRALAHAIASDGCIVSEYGLGMPAIASNFPRRNRVISGLARGVLVVEAAAQSGSLITARMALEQGREVFAIPGSIHSPLSKGCHQLIKQGAKLVESVQDVLEEFGQYSPAATPAAAALPDGNGSALLLAMGHDPVDSDTLALRTGMDPALLGTQLLTLELDRMVELLPDGNYRRLV